MSLTFSKMLAKQNSVQESGSAYTIAGVNGILCNRLAILAPNSCHHPEAYHLGAFIGVAYLFGNILICSAYAHTA